MTSQPAPAAGLDAPGAVVRSPVLFRKHPKARSYVLRVDRDGSVTVTLPRGGTLREARGFLERKRSWVERKLAEFRGHPASVWGDGATVLLRGVALRLSVEALPEGSLARLGEWRWSLEPGADVRRRIERTLFELAQAELPRRLFELARTGPWQVERVTVRDQRTRWGSCSSGGRISLNWRLIQTPDSVRDYVMWHELMHLKEMNHSERFWQRVAEVCPNYEEARRWLKTHHLPFG